MAEKDNGMSAESLTGDRMKNFQVENSSAVQIKLYRSRWIVLLLFILFTLGVKTQFIQYTIILNVITKYYGVSSLAVKCTAMVFNVSFAVLVYPAMYLVERAGLRGLVLLGSASACLGTWLKCLALEPHGFPVLMLGQSLVGACQVVVLCAPSALAARWFGPGQLATATAIGYSGLMLGIAGFSGLMPRLVAPHPDPLVVRSRLQGLALPQALGCSAVLLLVVFFFKNEPALPPSKARALQKLRGSEKFEFISTIRRLSKNRNFILMWSSHGFTSGQLTAFLASFGDLYLIRFKNAEKEVGTICLLFMVIGFFGCVVCGMILDKLKRFKAMMVALNLLCLALTLAMAISFYLNSKWGAFISIALYGLVSNGHYTVSFEISAELTYPESEAFCSALVNLANQVFAAIIVVISDKLMSMYSDLAAFGLFIVTALLGCTLAILTDDDRRRQNAGKSLS